MEIEELFVTLLERKSETPDDGGILDFIENYLDGFEHIRVDVEGVKNLFSYKKATEGKHLCFAGHVDVVPAGEGWNSDPYKVTKKEGYIYARGAQDMKSGVAAFVHAMKYATVVNGTLSLLLTSDEEGDAKHGTVEVLKLLKERNLLPDAVVVAEPTCEESFGDTVKVGRRGSINGVLRVKGLQGHAAYPEKSRNPIHAIAPVLANFAGVNLDNGDESFAPSKVVITDIRAGMEVTNVTPGELKIMFNVRNSTKSSPEDVKLFIEKQLKGLEYTFDMAVSAYPFKTDPAAQIISDMEYAIEEVCGMKTKRSTAGGTSDARFIGAYGIDTIEFGVKNDTIHAPNERTTLKEVQLLEQVFESVIKRYLK